LQEHESSFTVQFVRPQTRPCQSDETQRSLLFPGVSSKPPVPGPLPACVAIPGHIVESHLLVTVKGIGLSESSESSGSLRVAALIRPGKLRSLLSDPLATADEPSAFVVCKKRPMARVGTSTRQIEMLLTPLRLEEDPISRLAKLNSGWVKISGICDWFRDPTLLSNKVTLNPRLKVMSINNW
jgi:hypothetical protein